MYLELFQTYILEFLCKNSQRLKKKGLHLNWHGSKHALQQQNFFYLDFFTQPFPNHITSGKGREYFFNFLLPLPPTSHKLRH